MKRIFSFLLAAALFVTACDKKMAEQILHQSR